MAQVGGMDDLPASHQLRSHGVTGPVRRLHIVLGDQLDLEAPALRELDPARDALLMMEVLEESRHVPSHRQRTVLFLSAMRHFAVAIQARRRLPVRYVRLDDPANTHSFRSEIDRAVAELRPAALSVLHPGEWRVLRQLQDVAPRIEILPDHHFLCSIEMFREWAKGRRQLTMEHFYRAQRKRLGVLVDENGKPAGGRWNFDAENRSAFKRAPQVRRPVRFPPDAVTLDVMRVVEAMLPDAPGSLESFGWPVTREQAREALADFVVERLVHFGRYQDAMWTGEDFLYHSLLSPALNLKLLSPLECVQAATDLFDAGRAPLNAVEGFVRQIMGWREFVRGIYWLQGPEYAGSNDLQAEGRLPDFYWWGGAADMHCMEECLRSVREHGYGHHIARLMVTGNFGLIAGIQPRQLSDWYLAMYVDAVDWVTLPNVVGMVLHADGGVVGTKPYAASGKYIQRQSNYCEHCRYDVRSRMGEMACPFNTLYWDFLIRHRERFRTNQRMAVILRNVDRLPPEEVAQIQQEAAARRRAFGITHEGRAIHGAEPT